MMLKFNKFERVAGLFVITAIMGCFAAGVVVAVKKGWFERKVEFKTKFESAAGLTPGTQVQMAGLRVGSVDSVELISDNQVIVTFTIPFKHLNKIREDSVVHTIRPFLIGDKVLEITVGTETAKPVLPGAFVASEGSVDLMDIIGGRKLGTYLEGMGSLMTSLRTVLNAFSDTKRAEALVQVFDQLHPLLVNVNMMAKEMTSLSQQATRKKNLQKIVDNLVTVTNVLDTAMPQLTEVVESNPHLAKDMAGMVQDLSKLTAEMTKVLPVFTELAPELPRVSRRAIEAMDEAVVILKAMQKSFLLKGSVQDVREEEAALAKKKEEEKKKEDQSERMPASE